MNSDTLKLVLHELPERTLVTGFARDIELPTESGKVIGLLGPRRSGKTFLFFQTIRGLRQRGVDPRRILYLNFEDDRLHPLQAAELDLVLRSQREIFEVARSGKLYLFLDEVQAAPGWERWVRRLHDTEDISIFVTGSSSRLLNRDLSTAMRGRSIALEVLPLSFREFLRFRKIEHVPHDARSESQVRAAFAEFVQQGGFPEVVLAGAELRPLILEEYASMMVWRDLVERHQIRNDSVLRGLLRHCFRHTASLLSVPRLHRDLTSQGITLSKNTLLDYLEHLQDAGLMFLLPIHAESARKQARNPRKLHVLDTGLITAFKADANRDVGHKLETAVYLQARRRWPEWHYLADEAQIDLCDAEERVFVNSCWQLTEPATLEREATAMASGRRRFPDAEGVLLWHDAVLDIAQRIPQARPAWQWFLEQPVRGTGLR